MSLYKDALAMLRQLGINEGVADCLLGLAAITVAQGDPQRAARLLGASDMLREAINLAMPPINRAGYERIVATIRDSLHPEKFALARAGGRAMTVDQAIDDALNGR